MKCIIRADVLNRVRVALSGLLVAVASVGAQAQLDCRADINGSRAVDAVDLCMLIDGWGGASHDLNGDGIVNSFDIAQLLNSWGPCAYSTELIGRVVFATGKGVSGVSVTSSLGGSATTSGSGAFAFPIEFAWLTNSATVTAIASIGGVEYTGSKSVTPLVSGGQSDVGDIVLTAACAPSFQPRFGALPGVDVASGQGVYDSVVCDVGFGTELIVWGQFLNAGAVHAPSRMAAFDGHRWRAFGTGVYNTGQTPTSPASSAESAFAVVANELYVVGQFDTVNANASQAGAVVAKGVARWDRAGGKWTGLPAFPSGTPSNPFVSAITGADFGDGAGQSVVLCVDNPTPEIFRQIGQTWVSLGFPTLSHVSALAAIQSADGVRIYAVGTGTPSDVQMWHQGVWSLVPGATAGSKLCALVSGGSLIVGGTQGVQVWDGTTLTDLGLAAGSVECLTMTPIAGALRLVAGRTYTSAETVMFWNGVAWAPLVGSPDGVSTGAGVSTVASMMLNGVPVLFAGGEIATAYGGTVSTRGVARYEDGTWRPVGSGIDPNVRVAISRVEQGQVVHYIGGTFTSADGVALNGVARWDGTHFTPLGSGRANTAALCFHDAGDGSGELLYSGGTDSTSVARWTGATWQEVGIPSSFHDVTALLSVTTPSGTRDLYVGGNFTSMGGVSAIGVARWRNGQIWQQAGDGLGNANMNTNVRTLSFHTIAGASSVYAGGDFGATATGASKIARLDPMTETWMPLGQGLTGPSGPFVATMVSAGGKLYVGGNFSSISGSNADARNIAVWDGTSWAPLQASLGDVGLGTPGGIGDGILALAWMDYGAGPRLIAAGTFSQTIGPSPRPMNRIARWNGGAWSSVDPEASINGSIFTLVTSSGMVESDGIFLGGSFTNSAAGDSGMAEWSCN